MKALNTLLKLAKRAVEEKQKEIAEINQIIARMQERKVYLEQAMVQENDQAIAAADVVMLQAAGAFQNRSETELKNMAKARAEIERVLEEKRDELAVLYAEQRRLEILIERKLLEQKREREKKAQAQLDEIASSRHERQKAGS